MDIYVLNGLNGIIGMLETYESCIWTTQSMGCGNFEIITQATVTHIDLLKQGRLLVREGDFSGDTYKNVMIIESVKVEFDSERGWILTVGGRGLKSLVDRRIVWDQINSDDYQTVADLAYLAVIRNVSRTAEPEGDVRRIEGFKALMPSSSLADEADIQLFGENIAEWLEQMCMVYGYTWDVTIKKIESFGPYYVWELWKGTDRSTEQDENPPVVFSQEFDNLLSATYTSDRTRFRNAALIGGEGEGTSQITVSIGDAKYNLGRREIYIDGAGVSSNEETISEAKYKRMLQSYGRTELWGYTIENTFEGQVEANGTYILGDDYFLGDRVTVDTGLGITAHPIITEIIDSISEDGRTTILNFNDWEVQA